MLTRIIVSIFIGIFLATLIIIPLKTHQSFTHILANQELIVSRQDTGLTLLDRHGEPFFRFYSAKPKQIITLSEVPLHARQAILAMEDRSFFSHHGISPSGIARAFLTNTRAGEIIYGGSTITQQVIKNTLLSPEKSYLRKYQEIALAVEMELRYTKDEILEMYVNTVYFGEGAFGLEEAAQTYFGQTAEQLTLAQSAFLVGLMPSPSILSPLSNSGEKAHARQRLVLQTMVEEGYISLETKRAALDVPLGLKDSSPVRNNQAPHFAILIRNQLIKKFGEAYVARAGLRVTTTLDIAQQQEAERALAAQLDKLQTSNANNGAVIVIEPQTHQVRALVGSRGWFTDNFGKINMAIAPRQTGSAFKPIVYAAGLENKTINSATILHDLPTTFGKDYRPQNYDNKFRGPVYVRQALANSLNIPAVAVMQKTGVRQVAHTAQALGITTLTEAQDYNLALALGAGQISLLELTNAYATFANHGQFTPAQTILAMEDKAGQIIPLKKPSPVEAVSRETAFLISSILSDNKARAPVFGNSLSLTIPAAAKTGTSQSYRDAWTIGYTPEIAIGVWIGNSDNQAMRGTAGALGAAPVWRDLTESLSSRRPALAFNPPATLAKTGVCRGSIARQEYFPIDNQPQRPCPAIWPIQSASPTPEQPIIAEQRPQNIPLTETP